MSLSRVKVWIAEILQPTDINGEFNNILNYINASPIIATDALTKATNSVLQWSGAAWAAVAMRGSGTLVQSCDGSTGSLGASSTTGTLSLPTGGGLILFTEVGGLGSSNTVIAYHNQGGTVGLTTLGIGTSSGVTDMASFAAAASGFTATTKGGTGTVNYKYTYISVP